MNRRTTATGFVGAVLLAIAATGWAKLPPPTPEQVKDKQAKAEKKAKDDEAAKKALARAQDRVVARYKAKGHK